MSALRDAIATIAGAAHSPDGQPGDDVRPALRVAGEVYAAQCREVNERLTKCEHLIVLGQRSEALRQAQLDPDLLKRYAELDFPARAAWAEYAARHGLPAPPALNTAAAAQVNAAYAAEDKVRPLLRQHRTLALLRAPLRQRLDVLRLLVRAEPGNPAWVEDVGKYELARCTEILQLAAKVRRDRDWTLIQQLLEETESPAWVTRPPLEVIDSVRRVRDEINRAEAQRGLVILAGRLDDAVRDRNLDDAAAVEGDMLKVLAAFGLREDDPLADPFGPGVAWIRKETKRCKREQSFERAVDDLRQALRDADAFESGYVTECYRAAAAHDLPIPEDVLAAYQARVRRLRVHQVAWVAGGVLVAAAGVLAWVLLG